VDRALATGLAINEHIDAGSVPELESCSGCCCSDSLQVVPVDRNVNVTRRPGRKRVALSYMQEDGEPANDAILDAGFIKRGLQPFGDFDELSNMGVV
jgi:hypothetical protein